ncbi:MAG TPA: universal stress protein [Baekduia sp.]|nr:universal stress protein [Baekduia sp.]
MGPMLLCFDGSPEAAAAIRVAARLLAPQDAVVGAAWQPMLVTDVVPGPEPSAAGAAACLELDRCLAERAQALAGEGCRHAAEAGLTAEPRVVSGPSAAAALHDLAREVDAAVVVLGGRAAAVRHPWLQGSVSRPLAHHADRPVLLTHALARSDERDGPVLLCYEGSDPARHAIATAGALLGGGPAVVVHAYLAPSHALLRNPLIPGPGPLAEPARLLDETSTEAAGRLAAEGAVVARDAGFDAEPRAVPIAHGLWRTLLAVAAQRRCRAIVAGSRGWSGTDRALGTVADRLATRADRPVLLVPAPPA